MTYHVTCYPASGRDVEVSGSPLEVLAPFAASHAAPSSRWLSFPQGQLLGPPAHSTCSPSNGCYSLPADKHQEAKSPTQSIQKMITFPQHRPDRAHQHGGIALSQQRCGLDNITAHIGRCGNGVSGSSGRWPGGSTVGAGIRVFCSTP